MQNKKILLLGSAGMAGHVMLRTLQKIGGYDIIDVTRNIQMTPQTRMMDVKDHAALTNLIRETAPDFIINCIGVLIKGSNTNPGNAIYINACLPHMLANTADDSGAKLIHISTDCVFAGVKGGYVETDFTDGRDVYAKSKALGEVTYKKHLTIRTSIIGPELKAEGEGLLHWFLHQNGVINGYINAFWSGITTLELAKAIVAMLPTNAAGLYHLTNGIPISKYDLLGIFKKHFGTPVQIQAYEGKKVDKSLRNTRTDFIYEVPSYDRMVEDMRIFMEGDRQAYKYPF